MSKILTRAQARTIYQMIEHMQTLGQPLEAGARLDLVFPSTQFVAVIHLFYVFERPLMLIQNSEYADENRNEVWATVEEFACAYALPEAKPWLVLECDQNRVRALDSQDQAERQTVLALLARALDLGYYVDTIKHSQRGGPIRGQKDLLGLMEQVFNERPGSVELEFSKDFERAQVEVLIGLGHGHDCVVQYNKKAEPIVDQLFPVEE